MGTNNFDAKKQHFMASQYSEKIFYLIKENGKIDYQGLNKF